MVQLLIQLDDETAAKLEKAAPARSRTRSEFVRMAIRKALWDLEEEATARAYREVPDEAPAYFAAETWEQVTQDGRRPRPRKKKR
jgi:predicted transcriptional regulator